MKCCIFRIGNFFNFLVGDLCIHQNDWTNVILILWIARPFLSVSCIVLCDAWLVGKNVVTFWSSAAPASVFVKIEPGILIMIL